MNKRINTSILAIALVLVTAFAAARFNQSSVASAAPTSVAHNAAAATADTLTLLPASDAVAYLDVRRLLTEAIPGLLASDATKLAKFNAQMDKFKAKTGFDVRSFDRIAVGIRYSGAADSVAIARGTFNADALIAAGRIAANGKFTEQKHAGKTIYNFPLTEKATKPGAANKVTQLYVAALDANTLAIGKDAPTGVRAAIDASSINAAHASADLIALASRNSNALMGFGGNVPASLAQGSSFGNAEIDKSISSIRQAYGSLSSTGSGIETLFAMITGSPDQAKTLSDTIGAFKQFSGLVVSQVPVDQRALVQSLFDSLQITPQGNEVQIKASVSPANLAAMVRGL